jgi:hypothetical protein
MSGNETVRDTPGASPSATVAPVYGYQHAQAAMGHYLDAERLLGPLESLMAHATVNTYDAIARTVEVNAAVAHAHAALGQIRATLALACK